MTEQKTHTDFLQIYTVVLHMYLPASKARTPATMNSFEYLWPKTKDMMAERMAIIRTTREIKANALADVSQAVMEKKMQKKRSKN